MSEEQIEIEPIIVSKEAFELAVQGIQNTIEYTKDSQGNRIKVTIGYQEFKNLLIEMENVEDLLAYYVAIAEDSETIPFKPAPKEPEM